MNGFISGCLLTYAQYEPPKFAATLEPTTIPVRAPRPNKPKESFQSVLKGEWEVSIQETTRAKAFKVS